MAFLVGQDIRGAMNGSSEGAIYIREIIEYVEKMTGAKAVLDKTGENTPYNGGIYGLLDYYIQLAMYNM